MSDRYADQSVIRRLLAESRTWAFVGLHDNPRRTVYEMARLLQGQGKRIVPVHPSAEDVLGEPGYAELADVPVPIDVVGVYRSAEHAGAVADEAIAVGAKAVWFPLDVVDEAAAERVLAAGIEVVMDRCPAIELRRRGKPVRQPSASIVYMLITTFVVLNLFIAIAVSAMESQVSDDLQADLERLEKRE